MLPFLARAPPTHAPACSHRQQQPERDVCKGVEEAAWEGVELGQGLQAEMLQLWT